MKLDQITKKQDEYYTPKYAIVPILDYIPQQAKVWCPFDTKESLYVKLLMSHGCEVTYSHISEGQDFFSTEPHKDVDFIISNPPYSLKGRVFERLAELRIPFAMLVGVVGIFESQQRFDIFRKLQPEVMYFNRRVSYFQSYAEPKPSRNPPFSSVYICKGVLPQQLVFKEIDKKDL